MKTTKEQASLLQSQLTEKDKEIDKLQKFKDYVHERLDKMGVPVDPESPHKAAGCRIGGRLDYIESEVERLKKENEELNVDLDNSTSAIHQLQDRLIDKESDNERLKKLMPKVFDAGMNRQGYDLNDTADLKASDYPDREQYLKSIGL